MEEKKWIPPDDFYKGYSLYQHFGYGPEGELNLTKNLLTKEGYPDDNMLVKETLELTRDLVPKIQELCSEELEEFKKLTKRKGLVGGTVPFAVLIAKDILVRILRWASGKIKSLAKALTISEEDRILNKVIDKLQTDEETNEIIIQSKTTYHKTYKITKKQKDKNLQTGKN